MVPGSRRTSGPGAGAVWSITRPSRRNTTRSAHAASCASWVTTTPADAAPAGRAAAAASRPRRSPSRARRSARRPAAALRSPTTARAMATRWRSPPDSSSGNRSARSASPSSSSAVHRHGRRGLGPHAVELQRERDVLERGQAGQEVEVLEHVADRPAAQPGPVACGTCVASGLPPTSTSPLDRLLEAAGDRQQRALARAARSHDRDELAGRRRPGRRRAARAPRRRRRRRTSTPPAARARPLIAVLRALRDAGAGGRRRRLGAAGAVARAGARAGRRPSRASGWWPSSRKISASATSATARSSSGASSFSRV